MKKNSAKLNGNTEVEIDACRAILKLEPDNRDIELDLADALIRNDELKEAMHVYDDIQTKDPKDAEVIILRGKLKAMMGDGSSAVALYHEAVLEDPDNSDTLDELANALCDSGEYKEALNMISRAIELSPEVPKYHITRSRIFLSKKDTEGALASLTDALDDVAENGCLHMRIGEIYEQRGDLDKALTSYDAAIRNGTDDGAAQYRRGCVLESLGNREAAKKSYAASAAKDPSNVRAWERMGTMQLEDNDTEQARKSLDSALAADPFDLLSLLNRARLYVKEGSAEKAIPIYRALSSRDDRTKEIENELNSLLKAAEKTSERTPERVPDAAETPVTKEHDRAEDDAKGDTYDLALLTIEQAYATGCAISDEKMLSKLGINGSKREAVLKYLSDIEEYGDIDTSS
ncbi:MAG: tetratricopeptide repeat protein, partial [Methanomassiliicoccaceae archaeon]|nr:tetratricopeptide repeat protein [Methanomassiliicoccaceae archaeon]